MALIFVLVGGAWLLYFCLPVDDFAYFWGFFAMAAILLVLGAIAGLIAARIVKRGAPPVPTMAIDEARKIRETVAAPDASPTRRRRRALPPVPRHRRRRRRRRRARAAGTGGLMPVRSARREIRNSIEANRAELAVSVDRLRGEVTRLTDWRAHVERHRREIIDRRGRRRASRSARGCCARAARRAARAAHAQASSARGTPPTPISPGPGVGADHRARPPR